MPEDGASSKGYRVGKMPDPSRYEPKAEDVQDPFHRELLQQLKWMNANLFELRNNVAMVADWIQMERERERAKHSGRYSLGSGGGLHGKPF